MRQLHIIALVLSASFLMAACSSAPKLNEGAPVESHSGNMDGADARSVGTVNAGSSDPLNDPQGALAKRSIYFDLDSYTVKALQENAADRLPPFRGVGAVDPDTYAAYQTAAQAVADEYEIARVHLDIFWWRDGTTLP